MRRLVALNLVMPLLSIGFFVGMATLFRSSYLGDHDWRPGYFVFLWCVFASVTHSVSLANIPKKTAGRGWAIAGAVLDVLVVMLALLIVLLLSSMGGFR